MVKIFDINLVLEVAKIAIMRADEHKNCFDMLKRANQFIEEPNPIRALIFLGALLALDGEENLPTQAEGQIWFVKMMSPHLQGMELG